MPDTIASLQGSYGEVILLSEVHDLLHKIYDILNMALSK